MRNLSFSALAAATFAVGSGASANMLVNGDFQSGSLSAGQTTYMFSNDMWGEKTWNIATYDTYHPLWVDYFDHTTGDESGMYMVVNGDTSSTGFAYRQAVGVSPNTSYDLSGWFASLYPASVAALDFRIMDVDTETYIAKYSFTAPGEVATWAQSGFTFNSGGASNIAVEIWDTNAQASGNDYSIDDLALTPTSVPEPVGATLASPALLLLGRRRT